MPTNHPELTDLLRQAQTLDEQLPTTGDPTHYRQPLPAVFQALQLHAKQSGAWCPRRAGVDAAPHRNKAL
ncbi:hypothetical protein TMS3_0100825 [Pseudomonas taeanensis MS-3]|jgi:hypothetical protein|uniref:Uncharacterized protein n=1 Tax=Pseudomonas taeanensis MS-3 TaxID=1395571 RepID=A0A0A1YKU3_9PSED|nr:hypothetical protein [Pseudomonas taeanensis]KFX70515.1 hypothetical protein TMS3_0100825 [Pseudomonas taeanensis MS-3]